MPMLVSTGRAGPVRTTAERNSIMKIAHLILTAALAGTAALPAAHADGPPTAPAGKAFTLRLDGKSDEARALLDRALAENPDDEAAWFELARAAYYHFQFNEAKDAIAKAMSGPSSSTRPSTRRASS
jgi:tetratricopeptide (TPR) repeat protein